MANYLLIRHKVQDFSQWKPAYDAHLSTREQAGLREVHLLQGADDVNEVVILLEATDLDGARAFAASADLHDIMQKAGVIDQPDLYFLNG